VTLIPPFGVTGAALGSGAVLGFYSVAHMAVCVRLLGISLAPLARSLARGLCAAAAMALVLRAFGTDALDPAEWLLGGGAGTLTFAAVLTLTREVRLADWLGLARGIARQRHAN